MNIVIVGAGSIGLHLSKVFSQLNYGIVLVDTDSVKLEKIGRELDVATKVGDGTDWELIESLMSLSSDMLIAVTNHDEINLVVCNIAKNLGYTQTIARVRKNSYHNLSRLHFEKLFSVDHLIGPEKLTAESMANMILTPNVRAKEHFAHGAIQMRTMYIPENFHYANIPFSKKNAFPLPKNVLVGLIKRKLPENENNFLKNQIIFPHGHHTLLPFDEATFIGESDAVEAIYPLLGYSAEYPQTVLIVGGSLITFHLSHILHAHNIRVTILEKEFRKCRYLATHLPFCTILNRDGTDFKFLEEEKVAAYDVFIAATRDDEVNFLSASAAQSLGSKKILLSLSDSNYIPLLNDRGIAHAASPRIFAANRIFSIVREKNISSMISMYENRAEILEVKVSTNSKITGIPIKYLGPYLPKDLLIIAIQSRGRVFIADGTRVLSPGDTVIVISNPKHVQDIKTLF